MHRIGTRCCEIGTLFGADLPGSGTQKMFTRYPCIRLLKARVANTCGSQKLLRIGMSLGGELGMPIHSLVTLQQNAPSLPHRSMGVRSPSYLHWLGSEPWSRSGAPDR